MRTQISRLERSILTACLVSGILSGGASLAGAQPAPTPSTPSIAAGDFEIGFGVGGMELDSRISDDTERRTELRAGYFLTDRFELEVQAARTDAILDVTVDQLFANAAWHFQPDRAAVPYVLVGVGQTRIDDFALFGQAGETETGLAYQAALGSRFYFGESRRWAARLELSASFDETLDESNSHVGLTGGLVWRLGR